MEGRPLDVYFAALFVPGDKQQLTELLIRNANVVMPEVVRRLSKSEPGFLESAKNYLKGKGFRVKTAFNSRAEALAAIQQIETKASPWCEELEKLLHHGKVAKEVAKALAAIGPAGDAVLISNLQNPRAEIRIACEQAWYLSWKSLEAVRAENEIGILVEFRDHVFFCPKGATAFTPLQRGKCPQWINQKESRFYFFLPLWHDGLSELWVGDVTTSHHEKVIGGRFFINSSPQISPNGRLLAHVVRPLSTAMGDRSCISLIEIAEEAEAPPKETMVFQTDGTGLTDLRFLSEDKLQFKAGHELKVLEIANKLRTTGVK